ncbi:hypothetical protein KSC_058190 [Ktedonobacter sp. SOSP1-52]|nr:hypothetical protein KSC_058190 [Ktedonobacter sp. SOSP1-52]
MTAFTEGYLDEKDLGAHMEGIRSELFTLPTLPERDREAIRQASSFSSLEDAYVGPVCKYSDD